MARTSARSGSPAAAGRAGSALERDAKQRPPAPTAPAAAQRTAGGARSRSCRRGQRAAEGQDAAARPPCAYARWRSQLLPHLRSDGWRHMRMAPYKTRSRRRQSPSATPGAEVFASLQAPGPRATRTQACSSKGRGARGGRGVVAERVQRSAATRKTIPSASPVSKGNGRRARQRNPTCTPGARRGRSRPLGAAFAEGPAVCAKSPGHAPLHTSPTGRAAPCGASAERGACKSGS